MNKLFIVGNLTRDPEIRTTSSGISVCTFTVAVNRRRSSNAPAGQPEADFFRVSAWRQLGENCSRYLAKGRKVAVVGSVAVQTYQANDGTTRASLEVNADDIEFLTPRAEAGESHSYSQPVPAPSMPQAGGYIQVDDDELPF